MAVHRRARRDVVGLSRDLARRAASFPIGRACVAACLRAARSSLGRERDLPAWRVFAWINDPNLYDAHPLVSATRRGLHLKLDLRDNMQRTLYFLGGYEDLFTDLLETELQEGDVFVDVGAHIGYHSLTAARLLSQRGGGRVITIEPAEDSLVTLRGAAKANRLPLEAVHAALRDRDEAIALRADPNWGVNDAGVRTVVGKGPVVGLVPGIRFDTWASQSGLDRVDLVKIDVKGAEWPVLSGMLGSILRFRPRVIVVEVKPPTDATGPSHGVADLLAEVGYRVDTVLPGENYVFRPSESGAPPRSTRSGSRASELQRRDGDRYWWFKLPDHDYTPPPIAQLSDDEWRVLVDWYDDTDARRLIGECNLPAIAMLQALVMGSNIRSVVQLGHYSGYSTLLLGWFLRHMGARDAMFSVDIDDQLTRFTQEWVSRAGLDDVVRLHCGDSADAELPAIARDAIGPVRLVFIDSSHQYDHTLKELDLWYDALEPGGLLVLHDASLFAAQYDHAGRGGVNRAMKDWCSRRQFSRFALNESAPIGVDPSQLTYGDGCGLGFVQKPFAFTGDTETGNVHDGARSDP